MYPFPTRFQYYPLEEALNKLTRMAQCNPTILFTQLTEGILRSNACYLMKSHRAPCIQIPAPSPHSHLPHIQTHVRSPVFPVPVH